MEPLDLGLEELGSVPNRDRGCSNLQALHFIDIDVGDRGHGDQAGGNGNGGCGRGGGGVDDKSGEGSTEGRDEHYDGGIKCGCPSNLMEDWVPFEVHKMSPRRHEVAR